MKKIHMIVLLFFIFFTYNCGKQKTRTIRISGAWALFPMMSVWADEYQKITPVQIEVTGGGAGKGMADVLNGQVDIAMCSRPVRKEEKDLGAFYVAVTKDAVVAVVNAANPVLDEINKNGMSKKILETIFLKKIIRWSDVFKKDISSDHIMVYGRADASGAAKVWASFLGNYLQSNIQDRADANFNGDQALCNGIKANKNAIGFCNINYVYNLQNAGFAEQIRPVPLDLNQNNILDPHEAFYHDRNLFVENITNSTYPSPPSRLEYLVAKNFFNPEAEKFLKWILTDGQKFVLENGYVKLSEEKLSKELNALNKGAGNK